MNEFMARLAISDSVFEIVSKFWKRFPGLDVMSAYGFCYAITSLAGEFKSLLDFIFPALRSPLCAFFSIFGNFAVWILVMDKATFFDCKRYRNALLLSVFRIISEPESLANPRAKNVISPRWDFPLFLTPLTNHQFSLTHKESI